MRISLVTETFPPEVNGVARTLFNLVKGLKEKGHEMQVIRPKQQDVEHLAEEPNIEHVSVLSLPLPGYRGLRIGLPSRNRCVRIWKKTRPDVIYIATEGPLGYSALQAAKRLKIPVTSGFHTNFQHYMMHYNLGLLKDPAELYLKDFHNRTLATFAPTEDTRDRLFELGFKNLKLMGRGVDTHLFTPSNRNEELRKSWGAGPHDPVCLYVGRIASEKNMKLFFRTIHSLRKNHDNVVAVVVGDGPERKTYEADNSHVIFAGMKKGEDLAEYYASADYFLFPSLTETFGNVVTEALASGLIIVAFNYAAPRLYITSGQNGFLADMDDSEDFIQKTQAAVKLGELRDNIKKEARRTAQSISWDRVVENFEHDINEILSEQPDL
ncbi:MAG: glycosyltransferase family 1 protein [Opitutales bacterium]|nr:glycosyltransferase family 1 protein [Opitutales bacterium]